MIDLLKIAAAPVKAIVDAFLKLPKEVQTVLVGAFAVNKLTGGLVTNAAGGIIEAIGKGLLGGIKAPLVNVQGGVVNVGGAGGIGGVGAAGAGGKLGGILKATIVGAVVVEGLALWAQNMQEWAAKNQLLADQGLSPRQIADAKFNASDAAGKQAAIKAGYGPNGSRRNALSNVAPARSDMSSIISDLNHQVGPMSKSAAKAAASAALAAAAARSAASASMRKDAAPSVSTAVKVTVNVTAGGVKKVVTVQSRYGPAAGSRTDDRFSGYTPGI
jgi:hypothetical protein